MKKFYRVETLTNNTRDWDITIGDETIMASTDSILYMEEKYGDFLWYGKYDEMLTKDQNIATAKTKFKSLWSLWKAQNAANWERMLEAIQAEYSPIENVDEYIDPHTDTTEMHKGTLTESTPGVKTTTTETPRAEIESKGFVYGGNDAVNGAPDTRSVSKGVGGTNKTEVEHTGNDRMKVMDIDAEHFDKNVSINAMYHRHGNIGVTKSTELVESELALRAKIQLGFQILEGFVKHFTFYSSEEEGI